MDTENKESNQMDIATALKMVKTQGYQVFTAEEFAQKTEDYYNAKFGAYASKIDEVISISGIKKPDSAKTMDYVKLLAEKSKEFQQSIENLHAENAKIGKETAIEKLLRINDFEKNIKSAMPEKISESILDSIKNKYANLYDPESKSFLQNGKKLTEEEIVAEFNEYNVSASKKPEPVKPEQNPYKDPIKEADSAKIPFGSIEYYQFIKNLTQKDNG